MARPSFSTSCMRASPMGRHKKLVVLQSRRTHAPRLDLVRTAQFRRENRAAWQNEQLCLRVVLPKPPLGKNLCGIGTAPEGIGTIPVVYDMVYDMAWREDSIDIKDWVNQYTQYRYGKADPNCNRAWEILSKTIYECHNEIGGPSNLIYVHAPPIQSNTPRHGVLPRFSMIPQKSLQHGNACIMSDTNSHNPKPINMIW